MKLRLLNASHSAFAYLGFLAGHEFIYQVAAQWTPRRATCARLMLDYVPTTLVVPQSADLAAYQVSLLERFTQSRAAASHAADRDGWVAEAAAAHACHGARQPRRGSAAIDLLRALAVAGWMRYVAGRRRIGSRDQGRRPVWLGEFARLAAAHRDDPAALARSHCSALRAIFGDDLPARCALHVRGCRIGSQSLYADGAARTVAARRTRPEPRQAGPARPASGRTPRSAWGARRTVCRRRRRRSNHELRRELDIRRQAWLMDRPFARAAGPRRRGPPIPSAWRRSSGAERSSMRTAGHRTRRRSFRQAPERHARRAG